MRIGVSLWNVSGGDALSAASRLRGAGAGLFHWDRTDGVLARTGGFTVDEAAAIASVTGARSEVHLMMMDPLPEIEQWCDFCEWVIVHVESPVCREAVRVVERRGRQPGLAIAPGTPVDVMQSWPGVPVLVMSVNPGEAGAAFLPGTSDRLTAMHDDSRPWLGVDGGVTLDRLPELRSVGANWVAVGTDLLESSDPGLWLRSANSGKG